MRLSVADNLFASFDEIKKHLATIKSEIAAIPHVSVDTRTSARLSPQGTFDEGPTRNFHTVRRKATRF
jgi:hypothetical protein